MAESAVERLFGENKNRTLQLLKVIGTLQTTLADHQELIKNVGAERIAHSGQIDTFAELANRLTDIVDYYENNTQTHLELLDKTKGFVKDHSARMASMDAAIKQVSLIKPKKGDPGKNADPVDTQALMNQIVDILRQELPKPEVQVPEPVDADALYSAFVARLQKEMPIDVSHIRNGASFLYKTRGGKSIEIKNEELMHGGGTGTGPSSNSVYNEVVSGSGTAWTLANTPIVGTVRLFGAGQKLLPTSNYTISGASITTIDSWPAGAISADYNF